MICPVCHTDYEDSLKNSSVKRKVVGNHEHYGLPYRILGVSCPECGVVSEFIQLPTGNNYYSNSCQVSPEVIYSMSAYLLDLAENNPDQFRKLKNEIRQAKK